MRFSYHFLAENARLEKVFKLSYIDFKLRNSDGVCFDVFFSC